MRILAFSDIHRNVKFAEELLAASADADVLIGAGDFATAGEGATETLDVLKEVEISTIIVSGNHDRASELAEYCSGWKMGRFLHGNGTRIEGVSFFGLGCEIPRYSQANWNESMTEQAAQALLTKAEIYDVLVTHTPPKGHVDIEHDDDHKGGHDGSASILRAIEERQPRFHFCGHMHDSWGQSSHLGRTKIHNLGPTLNWFEI